jgi:hypothetical protein
LFLPLLSAAAVGMTDSSVGDGNFGHTRIAYQKSINRESMQGLS